MDTEIKKYRFFVFSFCCLVLLGSCTMEKRLYRNGWYKENKARTALSISRNSSENLPEEKEIAGMQRSKPATGEIPSSLDLKAASTITIQTVKQLTAKNKVQPGDTARKKMTYQQARDTIEQKGRTIHPSAMNIYNLSLISLFASIFLVPGLVLAILTLCLAASAKRKVIATGDCVNENLDIIDAGRRIAWGVVAGTLIVGIILLTIIGILYLLERALPPGF
jgi:hypothetical protein